MVEFSNSDSLGPVVEISTSAWYNIGFTAARVLSGEDLDIDLALGLGLTITWVVAMVWRTNFNDLTTRQQGLVLAARLLSGENLDIVLALGLTITWIVATARLLPPRTLALLPQLEAHTEYVEGYSFLGEYHAKP